VAALDLDPIRDTAHEDRALGTSLVCVGGLPGSERSILSLSRYVGGQIQSPAMVAVAAVVVPHDGRALNDVFPTDEMGLGAPWAGHLKGHNRASIRSLDLLRSSMPRILCRTPFDTNKIIDVRGNALQRGESTRSSVSLQISTFARESISSR
jgi:hypothetical protein